MLQVTNRALLSLVLAGSMTVSLGSNAIGLAIADGSFQVNNSKVWGNSALLDGSTVETGQAGSKLRLNSGSQVLLGADSRARLYQSRAVLEKGAGQLESSAGYLLEARGLRIAPAQAKTVARVKLDGSTKVLVATLRGSVRVFNARGLLIANLDPGNAVNFDPQAGAAVPTKVSGCLLEKDGKFMIVDETTHVTMELLGEDLDKEVGKHVQIAASADSAKPTLAGASQLLHVLKLTETGKGCESKAAAAAAAGKGHAGTAGASAAGGLSTTTIAVIGSVGAVAGTLGGLALSGALGGDESRPATSR